MASRPPVPTRANRTAPSADEPSRPRPSAAFASAIAGGLLIVGTFVAIVIVVAATAG